MRAVLLALALVLAAVAPARAWWDPAWPLRVKVTADAGPNGANITDPIGRTQILLRLHGGNFDFSQLKDDGGDLRLIAGDDKTPLHYHIEKFDKKDQVALVWIDVPDMAPGTATSFYVYWGNANAADGSDPKGTYDPDQLLVYHFAEANGLPTDTTGYGNNALTPGTRDEAGLIGYGLLLDGKKPPVRINKNPSLAIAAAEPMTVSVWVQPSAGKRTSVLFSDQDGGHGLTIGLDNGVPYAEVQGDAGSARTNGSVPLSGDGWHQIVLLASDHLAMMLDDKPDGTAAATLPAINGQMVLGGALDGTAPGFVGRIDEFGIAKAARPGGAIAAQFSSEGLDAKLLTLDQPEKNKAGGAGYIAVLFRAVTPDAWVVIGILALMAMLTWYVMYTKATYLNRLTKANAAFRAEYRKALQAHRGDHFMALEKAAESKSRRLRGSSLARLARIGVQELLERVSLGRLQPEDGRLAPQSLDAIRAAMESGLGRELRRANSLMVVLTISIAGGPFLGLLGTVIGVMITFAAIAAAGDVNINAIAPGIAAALLATVTGLVVAIPALFAYNYLLLKIRDASAEMNNFVNETVTRMGETSPTIGHPAADAPGSAPMRQHAA